MIKYFTILLLLLIISKSCYGQKDILVLRKKNNNTYYHIGDKISFQTEGNESKITGRIIDLKDSVIVFEGFEVPLSKIPGSILMTGKRFLDYYLWKA